MLRISTRSGMISPTVTLWPEDKDWSCTCSSQAEVCAHVAAAVIALRHALQAGRETPPQRPAAARLRYCFTRSQGGLALARPAVRAAQSRSREGTLSAGAGRRAAQGTVTPTAAAGAAL